MDAEAEFTLTLTRIIPDIADQPAVLSPVPARSPSTSLIPDIMVLPAPLDSKDRKGCKEDFRVHGACAGLTDPDVFFRSRDEDIAKAYCRYCPVVRECLAFAMEPDWPYGSMAMFGVYGGLNEVERADLRCSGRLQSPNVE